MSYCAIITFKDGKAHDEIEFANAWGGAAHIWSILYDKYVKKREHDSWLSNMDPLVALMEKKDVPFGERIVLAMTLDGAIINRSNLKRAAADLREFSTTHPYKGVNHLPAWADAIEKMDADAVAFHHTSVCENPWGEYDEEKDEYVPYDLKTGKKHWEVYDELAKETP